MKPYISGIILFLFLTASVLAEPTHEQLNQQLTGKWGVSTVIEGINTYSTTEFKKDRTVLFDLTLSGSDGAYKFKSQGKWTIQGNTVHVDITFSDSPEYLQVGDKLEYHIKHIDEKTLKYTDDQGSEVVQQRM